MRKLFRFLLVLALAPVFGVITASAAPNRDQVIVGVFVGPGEVTVSEADTIILRQGWFAANSGYVRLYLHQSETDFTLSDDNGVVLLAVAPEEAADYWGPIGPRPDWPECPGDREAGARWEYPLPALEPGDYAVDFHVARHASLTDGCDWDGEGGPDFFGSGSTRHIVIHVLPG